MARSSRKPTTLGLVEDPVNLRDYDPWHGTVSATSFGRSFCAVFVLYFAVLAFMAGAKGDTVGFYVHTLLASVYTFSMAKSHSGVKRAQRRQDTD
jgi:hypothetical protein